LKRWGRYHLYQSDKQCPEESANRWSSVRYDGGNAWNYNNNGISNNNNFSNELAARPVTKFKYKSIHWEMDLVSLEQAYKASRKHNKRSEDMVSFELDKYARLRRLRDEINARSYTPLHNYSFMHRRGQKPREVFAAEPELKIMMSFALSNIAPLIEAQLSQRTFNNRVGMGSQLAVNTIIEDIYTVSKGCTRPCWIIKVDYKGYFPNMNQDIAFQKVLDIVKEGYHRHDKQEVIYCLSVACFYNPEHSRRKSPIWDWNDYPSYKSVYYRPAGIGGFIGYTFWQMVASLYPAEIDKFVEESITPHFARYVDDTLMVTDNKEMALAMIPELRRRLADIGITLHPKKFYCQKYEHGVEFLGYRVFTDRLHLKMRTIARALGVARSKERGRRNYVDAINSYLGMIKSTSDLKWARAVLDAVDKKWATKDYENYKIINNHATR